MTTFPRSPRILKGAILAFNPSAVPTAVMFQYNPSSLTRTLTPNATDKSGAPRYKGPPEEEIKLEAEIDATDQLEYSDPLTLTSGIHTQLAALEILLYPPSRRVIANAALAQTGAIEIIPTEAPLTLFIWGSGRILPVRVTEFSVTEDEFDVLLNPIRAKVSLTLKVLTYDDLDEDNPGYHLFLAHQVLKEALAKVGSLNSAVLTTGNDIAASLTRAGII